MNMNTMKVIGICGKTFSGKNTVCKTLIKNLPISLIYEIDSPVKESCIPLFNLNYSQLYGEKIDIYDYSLNSSPRLLFKKIVNDIRNELCEDFFINHLDKNLILENIQIKKQNNKCNTVIIPDIKFQNEINYLKSKWDAKIVRITRTPEIKVYDDNIEKNIKYLDYIDFEINNNSNKEFLEENIQKFLKEYRSSV